MDLSHSTFRRLASGQEVSTSGEILSYPATHYPDKVGLICGTRQWTFAQLDKLANQFANAVVTKLADRPGPVGIMSRNSAEYAIAHFGTARSGRGSVNYPTRCTLEEFLHAVAITNPSVLLADGVCRGLINEALQQLADPPLIISTGEGDEKTGSAFWELIEDQPESLPAISVNPDESGFVIFTGGTTGQPKAVLSSQRARAVSAMAASAAAV